MEPENINPDEAAERDRIVGKLLGMRLRAVLGLGGSRELQQFENDLRFSRQQKVERLKQLEAYLHGAKQLHRVPQVPTALEAMPREAAQIKVALDLIDRVILPATIEFREAASEAWQADGRAASALKKHLQSDLDQWGIANVF
jgi:hypothetical protein